MTSRFASSAGPSLQTTSLLEDLAVSPLVLLALLLDGLVPGPHAVDERLVLGLLGVELGELVALVVWGDIEGWEGLLATDVESTPNDGVVRNAENGGSTEEVLAAGLEAVEEAT